jgi:outer membrane protein TolC
LPINLPTALQLANVRAADIAVAAARVQIAAATLEQAQALWLPSITVGGDYAHHDGQIQNSDGTIVDNNHDSMMLGLGTGIGTASILDIGAAIFAPLAARQQVRAREADRQAASNDILVQVSDAYFNVQQARGELAGAIATTNRMEDLVRRAKNLAPAIVPDLEIDRSEAELFRGQQAEFMALERWKMASAELLRLLCMDSKSQVEPQEPPQLRIELIDLQEPLDDLVPIALTSRPELASQQAQVQLSLALLKQEQLRPLIPSILLRGTSTPATGTLAAGVFAGGPNDTIGNAGLRSDVDLQMLWQFDNLGFGNRAKVHEREAENHLAVIELFRTQDRIAAEVAQAYSQAQMAARRVNLAEREVQSALRSADKNLVALGQTKTAGDQVVLLIRPQEAVAAVQALAQAYTDYYGAIADANRAQFRLYRALGQPAQCVLQDQHGTALAGCTTFQSPAPTGPAIESVPAPRPSPDGTDNRGPIALPR